MTTTPTEPTPDPVDLEAIRQRLAQYAATDEDDAKHWALAGVLVASVPLLLAEIERLAALADAIDAGGLLVEPGSETRPEHSHLRIEYAVQVPDEASVRAITLIRRYAMQILDDLRTSFPDAYLVTRHHIVHDEPWQPVGASGDTP